jgi:hypothetical protein
MAQRYEHRAYITTTSEGDYYAELENVRTSDDSAAYVAISTALQSRTRSDKIFIPFW